MVKKAIPRRIKKAIYEYVKYLKKDGLSIKKAIIYGSWIAGKAHKWSDIDICVISSSFNKNKDPLNYLWSKKRDEDVMALISPVGFHPKNFIDENPLVWEIKKTGREIKV